MVTLLLLLLTGKKEMQSKPIPQYSMRGYIMRRKWKKANVNSSSFKMLPALLMISVFINTVPHCTGREIRGGGSSSRTFYDSSSSDNNATSASGDNEDGPHFSWIVQRKDCDNMDDGCFCENRTRNMTTVRCRCDNNTQVAHIKSPGHDIRYSLSFVQKEKWIWKFEQCSKVVIHPESLITVGGSHFHVEFFNISSFSIHESAFATRDTSYGSQNHVSVHFSQCQIDSLPMKTFPSFVNSIKFTRCNIRSLAHRFIYPLRMGDVTFESCKIDNIDTEAFYNQIIIDTLMVENSTVLSISSNGVASAMNKMLWINSAVQVLQEDALSGNAANVTLHNCHFTKVERNGFVVKTWNKVILTNNTFSFVARRGIDLSHHTEADPSVEISDNSWDKVDRDFIVTGSSDNPFISIRYNTFLTECECGNTFSAYLSTNGSRPWFHQELLNNSMCAVSERALECLITSGYGNWTESNMLPYDATKLLCNDSVYMCTNDVSEIGSTTDETGIPGRPQLPNRLRVLAYFIAVMVIFIIVSLLITICVFLCRRKIPRKKSPPDSPLQSVESAQGKKTGMPKSLSGGEYADIVFKHNNGTSVSRPRSMLLEDVEMEDKGVQTMPTELSSEVLEGLREKLSRPDSFWDAKETIDHLYDLIQVKELNSALSSPPDVTMCNGQSTTASTARLLPSTSSSPVAQITSAGVSVSIGGSDPQILHNSSTNSNDSSPVSDTPPPLPTTSPPKEVPLLQRYAQIRNKAKTAPLCEYADPSDSSMHIYSELTPQLHSEAKTSPGKNGHSTTSHSSSSKDGSKKSASPSHQPPQPNRESPSHKNSFLSATRRPVHNGPIICEYTEPKDVQTHVYAELSNNPLPPKSPASSNSGSPVKGKSVGTSPSKSHVNTITIAVPPPPISIPHSNSFHNSPRHLSKIRENELSSSNPSIATSTPVKIIHVNDTTTTGGAAGAADSSSDRKHPSHRRRWPSEKLKRSQSNADASGARSSTSVSSLLKLRDTGSPNGGSGSDTQKRPLPSIPSWPNRNEAKSQF